MTVFDLFQGRVEFALQLFGEAAAEDLRDLVGRHTPPPDFTGALEDFVESESSV